MTLGTLDLGWAKTALNRRCSFAREQEYCNYPVLRMIKSQCPALHYFILLADLEETAAAPLTREKRYLYPVFYQDHEKFFSMVERFNRIEEFDNEYLQLYKGICSDGMIKRPQLTQ